MDSTIDSTVQTAITFQAYDVPQKDGRRLTKHPFVCFDIERIPVLGFAGEGISPTILPHPSISRSLVEHLELSEKYILLSTPWGRVEAIDPRGDGTYKITATGHVILNQSTGTYFGVCPENESYRMDPTPVQIKGIEAIFKRDGWQMAVENQR